MIIGILCMIAGALIGASAAILGPEWPLLGLLSILLYPICPFMAIVAALCATHTKLASGEDPEIANDRSGPSCLPPRLDWMNTPDDPTGDQGMYEPAVQWWDAINWRLKTWNWLGLRNQCYGLFKILCAKYDGSPVVESTWWRFKIYSCQGKKEVTWPGRRVSLGYKVHTLETAKIGDPIWWEFMVAFWKIREY